MWGAGNGGGAADLESLVAQIKEMQRNDANAKEQWIAYTDMSGAGKRDPAKHDAGFLQAFLMQLNSGAQFSSPAGVDPLAEAVKMMQKRSSIFKQTWSNFCMQHGGGRNDPMKHDSAYHAKFFDHMAQQAGTGGMGMAMSPMMGGGDNPMKRMRDSSGMGLGTSSGDSQKDALVQQLKAFQRMGMEQKELWGTYADTYLAGVRDPSRHDASTLQEFCTNHGVSAAGSNGMGGGSMPTGGGMGGKGRMSMGGGMGGMPMGGKMGGGMCGGMASDPEKQGLVDRVKAFQRQGAEAKEMWYQFCGDGKATKDPNRHETQKLQEFCMLQGI